MSEMKNKVYRLDELCDIKSGKRIPKDMDFVTFETEHPYIRARDIKEGKIKTDDLIYLEDDVFQRIKRYIINSGDIAITIVGASVGDTGYAYENVDGYNLTENAVRLTNYNNKVDSKFLHYVLAQKQYHDYMQLIAGAAAQPKLGIYKVKRIKVELPDLEKQKRIADILSAYDNLIENNNKRIRLLEQMVENLYKEWFVRFRFPGYEDAEFENNAPRNWEWKMLADVTEVLQRGISPTYNDEGIYTVISQKCIRSKTMDISEARKQVKDYKRMLNLQDADTVICSTGTGTLGRVGKVIGNYPNTTFDSHVTLARARKGIGKQFLYGAIKNLQPWFMNMGIGSTNQQELYISLIRKAKILMPTPDLQEKYETIAKPLHDEIGLIIEKNKYLIQQRDMLLPRLMSGKLEV